MQIILIGPYAYSLKYLLSYEINDEDILKNVTKFDNTFPVADKEIPIRVVNDLIKDKKVFVQIIGIFYNVLIEADTTLTVKFPSGQPINFGNQLYRNLDSAKLYTTMILNIEMDTTREVEFILKYF